MRIHLLGLLLAVAASACDRRLSPARHAHAIQTVRGKVNEWARAVNNRAIDSLALLYYQGSELVVITPEGQAFHGWRAESARQEAWARTARPFNLVVTDVTVDVLAVEAAVVTFATSLDEEQSGARVITRGRVTQIWARDRDGTPWRIRSEHHSGARR